MNNNMRKEYEMIGIRIDWCNRHQAIYKEMICSHTYIDAKCLKCELRKKLDNDIEKLFLAIARLKYYVTIFKLND